VVSRRDAAIGESDNAAVGVDDVQPGSSIMMDITDASIATVLLCLYYLQIAAMWTAWLVITL